MLNWMLSNPDSLVKTFLAPLVVKSFSISKEYDIFLKSTPIIFILSLFLLKSRSS